MSRKVIATEFATAFQYEQAKKAARKADRSKRQSSNGRRGFEFQGSDQ